MDIMWKIMTNATCTGHFILLQLSSLHIQLPPYGPCARSRESRVEWQ